jgi:hypothetical protein
MTKQQLGVISADELATVHGSDLATWMSRIPATYDYYRTNGDGRVGAFWMALRPAVQDDVAYIKTHKMPAPPPVMYPV